MNSWTLRLSASGRIGLAGAMPTKVVIADDAEFTPHDGRSDDRPAARSGCDCEGPDQRQGWVDQRSKGGQGKRPAKACAPPRYVVSVTTRCIAYRAVAAYRGLRLAQSHAFEAVQTYDPLGHAA
jgi:hypothetical protein